MTKTKFYRNITESFFGRRRIFLWNFCCSKFRNYLQYFSPFEYTIAQSSFRLWCENLLYLNSPHAWPEVTKVFEAVLFTLPRVAQWHYFWHFAFFRGAATLKSFGRYFKSLLFLRSIIFWVKLKNISSEPTTDIYPRKEYWGTPC